MAMDDNWGDAHKAGVDAVASALGEPPADAPEAWTPVTAFAHIHHVASTHIDAVEVMIRAFDEFFSSRVGPVTPMAVVKAVEPGPQTAVIAANQSILGARLLELSGRIQRLQEI